MFEARHRVAPMVTLVLIAAACGSATPTSVVPSTTATASATATTDPAPSASDTSSPSITLMPTTSPPSLIPSPVAAIWSKPTLVGKGTCFPLTAAIDSAGRYHVASVCDGRIRYMTSADGTNWNQTSFVPPIDRLEQDPQLTLDGDRAYLAYSVRRQVEGACGDDGLVDVGVYTRSMRLPTGTWSDPARIGAKADRVRSFRVTGGVLYLTVTSDDGAGPLYYESQSGPTFSRVVIPGAVTASLRVGDDGHARIAYATGSAIRYARVTGAQLATTTVAASTRTFLQSPSLVLGPGDHAYLIWTENTDNGGGCVSPEPGPVDGVYFASDASGRWKTTRLTNTPDRASIALDPSSGRIDVVVDRAGPLPSTTTDLTAYESTGGIDWTSATIPHTAHLTDPVIRVNPATGSINVFATDYDKAIYLLTKP